jgi:hypothetical protein
MIDDYQLRKDIDLITKTAQNINARVEKDNTNHDPADLSAYGVDFNVGFGLSGVEDEITLNIFLTRED